MSDISFMPGRTVRPGGLRTKGSKVMVTKPHTTAEKTTRTTVDTLSFTAEEARAWEVPTIQREVKVNPKVRLLSEQIKADDGVIPGIVTLGILNGHTYLIDGQQRREAFFISEKPVGYADVRTCYFKTMGELGEEFVRLNSSLVRMTPDDILRGLEASVKQLHDIRTACPFVGYDRIRNSDNSALMLSMSVTIRSWSMSRHEVPGESSSAADIARNLEDGEAKKLISFLHLCSGAWGRDREYWRMWSALNLTISMWLYRRLVTDPPGGQKRSAKLSADLFKKCLMSLSANAAYRDWLVGRKASNVDRGPCYLRMKRIFAARLLQETGKKSLMPQPAWAPRANVAIDTAVEGT
jgi:hypothetical protein